MREAVSRGGVGTGGVKGRRLVSSQVERNLGSVDSTKNKRYSNNAL